MAPAEAQKQREIPKPQPRSKQLPPPKYTAWGKKIGRPRGSKNRFTHAQMAEALSMQSQVDRLAELKRDLAKQIGDVRADVVELFNDQLERIKLAGMSPLEYMLGVMRDPDAPAYVARSSFQ